MVCAALRGSMLLLDSENTTNNDDLATEGRINKERSLSENEYRIVLSKYFNCLENNSNYSINIDLFHFIFKLWKKKHGSEDIHLYRTRYRCDIDTIWIRALCVYE